MVSEIHKTDLLLNKNYIREATAAQVNGFPNGLQRGFKTYAQAQSAWLHSRVNHTVGPPPPAALAKKAPRKAVPPVSPAASSVDLKDRGISLASPSPQKNVPSTLDNPTGRRPAPHPLSISDEEAFWVVTRGERPGVYHGRHLFS